MRAKLQRRAEDCPPYPRRGRARTPLGAARQTITYDAANSATNYISAYYSWRLADGTTPDGPILFHSGVVSYPDDRWGDYSYTSLDPTDETTFWTVQEYAEDTAVDRSWGTWVARLKRKP